MSIGADILQAIGNTSLVWLRHVVPPDGAKILVKLEWENPTGNMKDRSAQATLARAEEDGRLNPGDAVVAYTGGSTGTSLALICVAKGYRLQIVTSDSFSCEKLDQMSAFGAALALGCHRSLENRPVISFLVRLIASSFKLFSFPRFQSVIRECCSAIPS